MSETKNEKIKILVIDDSPIQLAIMEKLLQHPEREIYKANGGKEGYELVKNLDLGLIILDINMPGLSGFETAELIKKNSKKQHIPLVFMTALGENEEEQMIKGFEYGAIDFIYKPININLTREKITSYLKIHHYRKLIEQKNEQISLEKAQNENLLLRILPADVVVELKEVGFNTPRDYKKVTVMFTDFVGFTLIAKKLSATDLVKELDRHFGVYDRIIERSNLEKIKTIGDSYMCAGGVPKPNETNPIDTILAALRIQEFVKELNDKQANNGELVWKTRFGIHTGEVTAGVIGIKRLAYDIWGDTVNIASRMEHSSEPGKINISGDTYKYIEPYFECEYRGKIEVKHGGEQEMYFVNKLKPKFSKDEFGIIPNIKLAVELEKMKTN